MTATKTRPPCMRDEAIRRIRHALQCRSGGKRWSVKGGRGTAWGWIDVCAPPARCTWRHVPKPHNLAENLPGRDNWDEIDTGKPGGHMGPADRAELAQLLGLESVSDQGESIPASSDYYQEFIDRAEGKTPSVIGRQYWD